MGRSSIGFSRSDGVDVGREDGREVRGISQQMDVLWMCYFTVRKRENDECAIVLGAVTCRARCRSVQHELALEERPRRGILVRNEYAEQCGRHAVSSMVRSVSTQCTSSGTSSEESASATEGMRMFCVEDSEEAD